MENKNSDIGHNSNLLIEDAFKETLRDAYRSSKKASDMALHLWGKFEDFFNKEAPLTKQQINWNINVDKYNDWVMQNDPTPSTNKKRLRKKYKPRKLTQTEIYDLYKEMDREFNELFDLSGDAAAYFRGNEDPRFAEIIEEVDNEEKF